MLEDAASPGAHGLHCETDPKQKQINPNADGHMKVVEKTDYIAELRGKRDPVSPLQGGIVCSQIVLPGRL
jgi:hypothetical protein